MAGEGFALHHKLADDTLLLASSELSELRLMNDAHYPWLLLVPRRAGVREIYELSPADQQGLLHESSAIGEALMMAFSGQKLNVAALGNMVPQLHLHHVVRFEGDAAWPGPVWGVVPAEPYSESALASMKERLVPVVSAYQSALLD
ncbi:MAG: HIT family protein [Alteromonadaceae bacterium]|uniref:HIT domain-containing protein n=1 Tax=Marinobacter sp. V034 TaxID=3459610 RepID=UPI000C68773A|nr:HIT family protein [Alteromonadaceae bacterium]MBH86111.1 HIT family protein [Alteromonadaceae bacterium]|tara:strand:- start:6877 stop:7314 length:438 start_codon:yes stop_codon:yes gene_type:complete